MSNVGGRFTVNRREIERLLESSAIARDLGRRMELGTQEAKRLCPTSPAGHDLPDGTPVPSGHLRSSIGWTVERDSEGWYGDIYCEAPAAEVLAVEFGTRPHTIRSTGDWPLRNARTGDVFGPEVQHPGTEAQPFLRPGMERALRG